MSKYINQKQLLMSLSDWQFGSQDDEQLWGAIEKVINSIESLPTIEVSEDCISREDLLKHAYKREGVLSVSVDSIKLAPSVVPTAEQSSMVGEWITHYDTFSSDDGSGVDVAFGLDCSFCGRWVEFAEPFCPNCGAKMKG